MHGTICMVIKSQVPIQSEIKDQEMPVGWGAWSMVGRRVGMAGRKTKTFNE